MLQNTGIPGLVLLLVLALIIFGPSKLPEIGRAFGTTLREFKKSTQSLVDDSHDAVQSREGSESEKRSHFLEMKKNG